MFTNFSASYQVLHIYYMHDLVTDNVGKRRKLE